MTAIRNQRIVDLARSYIGVPWKHQGRSRQGLDCIGLIYCVWCDLGLDPSVDQTGYAHISDGRQLRRTLDRLMLRSPEARRGVVVLLAQRGLHPLHLGLISEVRGRGREGFAITKIVHANARLRKVVEQRFMSALGLRPVAYYRYPDGQDKPSGVGGFVAGISDRRARAAPQAPSDLWQLTSDT